MESILAIPALLLLLFIPPVIIVLVVVTGGTSISWATEFYQKWLARVEKLELNVINLKIDDIEVAKEISKTCGYGFVIYAVLTLVYGLIWSDNIFYGFSVFCFLLGFGLLNVSYICAIVSIAIWPFLLLYFIYDMGFSIELIFIIDEIASTIIFLNGAKAVFYYHKNKDRVLKTVK